MIHFIRSRTKSFFYAFQGWWYVIRTQKNAWFHAVATIAVILVCLWLQISPLEWAVILLTISMVWTAEFFNTAIETIVDLTSPNKNQLAKISKDVGAAAVLITAATSVIIGFIILGPPLWAKISNFIPSP